jgi:hypothetical protein
MNQQVRQQMYLASISEMRKKLKAYESKPDANEAYIEKNKAYINAIADYVTELENQIRDSRFNAEFLILTEEGNSGARLKDANKRIQQLEAIIEMKGIKSSELPFLLQDSKEIIRANSISRAMADFPNLY